MVKQSQIRVKCNKPQNKVTVNRRWGWLAFNSGSTYGVTGARWQYAARAAVSTMMGSIGGGLVGLGFSLTNPNGIDILSQINGILGALVAITGTCLISIS
jgi:ammonia channel protein AmtB